MPVSWSSWQRPGKAANEDVAFSVGDFMGVLDGATVPPGISPCCDLGPAWYVRRLSAALIASGAEDPQAPLVELLSAGIGQVTAVHARHCPHVRAPAGEREPEGTLRPAVGPSATVALARRRAGALDYLVLCDSPVAVRAGGEVHVIADDRIEHLPLPGRSAIRERRHRGHGYDATHAELVSQMVREAWSLRNVEGGYWVAADEPAAADHALTGTLSGVTEAALLTDGVSRAVSSLGMYATWEALLDGLCTEGPDTVIAAIRSVEAADPDGKHHPRVSCHDDATALLWTTGR